MSARTAGGGGPAFTRNFHNVFIDRELPTKTTTYAFRTNHGDRAFVVVTLSARCSVRDAWTKRKTAVFATKTPAPHDVTRKRNGVTLTLSFPFPRGRERWKSEKWHDSVSFK